MTSAAQIRAARGDTAPAKITAGVVFVDADKTAGPGVRLKKSEAD